MKLSESPTLTRGLNKTLAWLMSVCGRLSWYWSFNTQHALRGLVLMLWSSIEIENRECLAPFLFIISLYVVQISQDMASVSLQTCLPCSVQAWNVVMCVLCNAGEKDPQWKLHTAEKCASVWLPCFILNKIQADQTAAAHWQKTNNATVPLFKISPVAKQSSKWQGCEIFRR